MIAALILLVLAEASLFAEKFYSVKRGQRSKRFWRFTWIIAALMAASTIAPIVQSHIDEAKHVESLKKRVFKELKINMETLEKWRVILNRQFAGVETLRTSMYDSGSLDQLPDEGLEQRIRNIYMLTEDLDRRLNEYRAPGSGYQNDENVRRVKNSVSSLIKNTAVALDELDDNYKYVDASDQQIIEKHIDQFQSGIATGNTISADSGQATFPDHYSMKPHPNNSPVDEDSPQ